jgi:hypothetical protein
LASKKSGTPGSTKMRPPQRMTGQASGSSGGCTISLAEGSVAIF